MLNGLPTYPAFAGVLAGGFNSSGSPSAESCGLLAFTEGLLARAGESGGLCIRYAAMHCPDAVLWHVECHSRTSSCPTKSIASR